MHAQRVCRAFEHFIDIGVVERIWRILVVLERLPAQRLGRADEVVHAAGLFILLERERDRDRPIGFDPRGPESHR